MNTKHDCKDYQCRRSATINRPFFFSWCELPNAYVIGIQYEECSKCGKVAGIFPAPVGLTETLKNVILRKPFQLTGPEIKYLRRSIRKKAVDFAEMIGVSPEQVSRWEHGHNLPEKSADKLIRLLAADQKDSQAIAMLNPKPLVKGRYLLTFRRGWRGEFIRQ
jgi:putative zinc finger/helix-turn-helix YgiT family protein